MKRSFENNEEGYTLIESVVAMSLFAGVLIPLVTVFGNLIVDRNADLTEQALLAARSEISRAESEHDFESKGPREVGTVTVERRVTRTDNLVEILVLAKSAAKPSRQLIKLHKSIVVYP